MVKKLAAKIYEIAESGNTGHEGNAETMNSSGISHNEPSFELDLSTQTTGTTFSKLISFWSIVVPFNRQEPNLIQGNF